jgi:serine/threonine-protein kinase
MTASESLHTGRMLGPYELLTPLAQGATAQVWAARTTGSHLEKIVAVKVMCVDEADDLDTRSMFIDEAQLVSRIRHPNVASVLDFAEQADVLYIVVEWVEGEPLQILMREAWGGGTGRNTGRPARGVPLPLALRIVKQAAAGLHAAHELCDEAGKPIGLVHRDVSPQNILVGYDGSVKVIDFGVAKATSNLQRTRIGQIKGKLGYMSPEQAMGDRVDRRSDVFALGIVLYQLVAGKHPFRGDSEFATLARIRDKAPAESPREYVPDLPDGLDEVMLCALAKRRDDRFPTMADLWRALERTVPPSAEIDRELGEFVGALLSQRAAKRDQAIRGALGTVRERTGSRPRPVNLSTKALLDDLSAEAPKPAEQAAPAPPRAPPAPSSPAVPVRAAPTKSTRKAAHDEGYSSEPPLTAEPRSPQVSDPVELPGVAGRSYGWLMLAAALLLLALAAAVIWAVGAAR